MAVVKWDAGAYRLFNEHVESARLEYGKKTAERWLSDATEIYERLRTFPESYTPEPLLRGRKRIYRSCRMMGAVSDSFIITTPQLIYLELSISGIQE